MKKLFAVLLFSVCASAQLIPTPQFYSSGEAPPIGFCVGPPQLGNFWIRTGEPANAFVGTYQCQQSGASTLGAGAYSWVALAKQGSSPTTGTISVANGKAAVISNSLTFAGTDSTVMTFPTTSATIARTDAANTFTGTQTVGALVATTVNGNTITTGTGTLTLGAGATATFPTTSITVPGTVVTNCGTANACSATTISATSKVVVGITAVLNGASPAIATVTGMPAFTSSSSYVCTANVNSASASTHVLAINYVSSSSVTFTAANGSTDTVSYICAGS